MRVFHCQDYPDDWQELFVPLDSSPMDLNELLVFTRVVQTGSFTAAARLLRMPKSSVSRKVSDLEERVGARLLQRTTRKLGVTDAGRIYFERSARIVSEIEEADAAVGQLQASPRGLLRVTAPLSFAVVGPILAEFLKRNLEVQVELVCTDRRVDLVNEAFDVGIRAGHLDDSTLIARNLGAMKRVLVAAPAYLRKRGAPKTPEELRNHDCLTFGSSPTPSIWTVFAGDQEKEIRITPRLSVNDFEILLDVVRAGAGVAWMLEFLCAEDLRRGKLQRVLTSWCSAETPVQAVYPSTRHLSPKVTAFVDLLRERFAGALGSPARGRREA
jgi:DNA-binding transcriptional LysR family regulator